MMLYAELPERRNRQLIGDVLAAAWTAFWIVIARRIFSTIDDLGDPFRAIRSAGNELADRFTSIAEKIGDVPFVGGQLRAPFQGAKRASELLEQAGLKPSEALHDTAYWVSIATITLPVLYILAWYLPRRIRWSRDAQAAIRMRGTSAENLLAFRYVANEPLDRLPADAAEKLRDPSGTKELAEAQLKSLGLRAG